MATTLIPLQVNAVKTTTSAPAMGYINRYDATSGALSVTLPALSGLNVGARAMVQKYTLDASANNVTFTRAGSDLFDDGASSFSLSGSGESRTVQVVLIGSVKRWKITEAMSSAAASLPDGSVTATKFALSTLVTESEGISANDNDTTIPTSAAVKNYADSRQQLVSVKDYGAVGDGITDDAAAIQAAVTAVTAGSRIYFPEGTYKVGSGINISKSVRLIGSASTTLKLSTHDMNILWVSSTSNVVIESLRFDGNRATLGAGGWALIYLVDVSNVVVRDCSFINAQSTGLSITRGSSIWVTGNRFSDINHSGIQLADPTAGNYNEHIWIRDNYLDTCQVSGTVGNAAIQLYGTGTVSHRYIHIADNAVTRPKVVGLGLDSIDLSSVTGNTIIKDGTSTLGGEAVAFTGANNVFAENYCYNDSTSSAAAILMFGVASRDLGHNQIINNRLTNAGQGVAFVWGQNGTAITDLLIQGNHCYGNNRGIQSYLGTGVTSGSQTNVVIGGNNLAGNAAEAINVLQNSGGVTGVPVVFANAGVWHTMRPLWLGSSATPSINTDFCDLVIIATLSTDITSMTTNLTGSPYDGDRLTIRIKSDATPRAIAWGTKFTGTLLTTTAASKTHVQELVYDGTAAKWAGTFVDTTGY